MNIRWILIISPLIFVFSVRITLITSLCFYENWEFVRTNDRDCKLSWMSDTGQFKGGTDNFQ